MLVKRLVYTVLYTFLETLLDYGNVEMKINKKHKMGKCDSYFIYFLTC